MDYDYKKRVTKNDKKNKKSVYSQKHIRMIEVLLDKNKKHQDTKKDGPVQPSCVALRAGRRV